VKAAPAQRIDKRELALVATLGAALALVCTWPLVLGLRSRIPNTLMDPPFKAWEVSWIGHAVREHPLHLWDANTYWPHDTTLAFSDAMVGTAPLTWLAHGFRPSLAAYNVLFLLSFALAFVGAYLLAREFDLTPAAGVVAGAAFAYSPVRFAHASHLHVLMSGGIALSLFLLLRGYRSGRWRTALAGWLVGAWQLSLGFSLGLQLAYLLAILALLVGVALVRRRPAVDRRLALATVAGAGVFALTGALLARPYLEVARDFPESKRTAFEISSLSPMPWSFVAAPEANLLWGEVTAPVRETLRGPAEQALFPGLTIVVLALVGVAAHVLPGKSRLALGIGVVATATLALGLHVSLGKLGWLLPYRYLFEFAPGWEGVRTPGRIFTLTSLGLAVLAAAGATALMHRLPRRRYVLVVLLAGAVVLEGYADIPYPRVPLVPPGQLGLGGPQLHLPTDAQRDSLYMLWSSEGFPPLVNGHEGFKLPPLDHIRNVAEDFPSAASVEELRERGIRIVVFHPERAEGTPWESLSDRRVRAPGVVVERGGGVVVYRLAP
jgi:hypothetical protein